MQKLDRVISLYQEGSISLFEAADTLDLHPSELTSIMVERSRLSPIVIRQ